MKKLTCFFMFFLLLNASVVFAETEEEKYRVPNIHSAKVSSGITTGGVIAYGHYIEPPYQVTMEEKDIIIDYDDKANPIRERQYFIYINRVQVAPELSLQELRTGKVIRGMEGADVARVMASRWSTRTMDPLRKKYYELLKTSRKKSAIQEIEKELKNNKYVKSYSIDTDKETIKTDFGDGGFECSFDDFARMGLVDKIRDFIFYLGDNFGEWENEYGKNRAEEMLYEKLKKNPLVEDYESFDWSTRRIKIKFKEKRHADEIHLQHVWKYKIRRPSAEEKKQLWESLAEGYRNTLISNYVEIILPTGGRSGVPKGIFKNGLKVLRNTDIDINTKIEKLGKVLGIRNEEAFKYIIYNFNPTEYESFGE